MARLRSRKTSRNILKAAIFKQGTKTETLLRFPLSLENGGAADAERTTMRGFALKFYTSEGNWDLVGNNTPVFFIRDPLKFPDFIHTQKRHPRTLICAARRLCGIFWGRSHPSLCTRSRFSCPTEGYHSNCRHVVMATAAHSAYSFINAQNEAFAG